MKKFFVFFSVAIATISCAKDIGVTNNNSIDRDFYQNGVHVTIKQGSPYITKSSVNESLTITGEKGDINYTIYTVCTNKENGFSVFDAFSECGTKIGTYVYHENELVAFEPSSELDSITEDNSISTKARQNGEKYGACVKREAKQMNDNIDNDVINAAVCDFLPCHAITLAVAIVDCTQKE